MTSSEESPAKGKTIGRRRLWVMVLVPISAIVAAVLVSMIWLNLMDQKSLTSKQVAGRNTLLAHAINNAIFDALSTGENDVVRAQFGRLGDSMQDVRIYVYDFNGHVSFSTDPEAMGDAMTTVFGSGAAADSVAEALDGGIPSTPASTAAIGNHTFQVNNLPIHNEQRCFHCHGSARKVLGGITVVSRVDADLAAMRSIRNRSITIGVVGLLALVTCIYLLFHRLVSRPVKKILKMARNMRNGDFTCQMATMKRDELAHILNRLNLVSKEMQSVFRDFINDSSHMAEASSQLAAISDQLRRSAGTSSQNSHTVAESAEEVSENMTTVTTTMEATTNNIRRVSESTDQLFATINEIAESSGAAQGVIDDAAAQFEAVSKVVRELGEAAREIDAVTDGIRQVSEQVNLLALNATIEAARAGEAGKGFAVVAQEIKALAQQAAEATDDADDKLRWMQDKTKETIRTIEKTAVTMTHVSKSVVSIASAVEEQTASTREISASMSMAAEGVEEVSHNVSMATGSSEKVTRMIQTVDSATREILEGSESVSTKAEDLSRLADRVRTAVKRFKV